MIPFYTKTKNQTVNLLSSDFSKGLSQQEAEYRLQKSGKNKITHEKKISKLQIFIQQFKNPLIYVLFGAIIISALIKEFIDALVIFAIVLLNSLLGYYQEFKAERALELLKKISAPTARVLRNKKIRIIPAENLVAGDIIILETGDKVPADARLLKISELKTNEAVLTGESNPVTKTTKAIPGKIAVAEQTNMVFAGTVVSYGRAMAIVTATGNKTEFGRIAFSLHEIEEEATPLQKKLTKFSKKIGILIIGVSVLLILIGLLRKLSFVDSFMVAVSLAVGAIPEGLPAVVTVALALGVQRMIKNKALIRRLATIESLGEVTVICSDKTGTMTKGEMTVTQIYTNNDLIFVSGQGYDTDGTFRTIAGKYDTKKLSRIMETAILCNNADLISESGDPTELALLVAAKKANIKTEFYRLDEIPFDSSKKFMATIDIYQTKKQANFKGAPEVLLEKCKYLYDNGRLKILTPKEKEKILKVTEKMAHSALRVLAFAYSKDGSINDLIFLGLMGMIDPPREEAKEAIALCKKAGIRVVMITGDNAVTAQAIAKDLGLGFEVLTGQQLEQIPVSKLKNIVNQIDIYARVNPEHKVKILEAFQDNGEIVAMTGDGINDAPALKKADVGVAMGLSGTDVSKEASDVILLDDNFNSIVSAVKHGRRIYDNIKKFVKLLIAGNFGEIGIILISLIAGFPLPLLPLQILWINLITDSLPAIALGVDPADKNIMSRPPRKPKEGILEGNWTFLIMAGVIMTIFSLVLFSTEQQDLAKARTMVLVSVVIFELLLVFACRSHKGSIFQADLGNNKLLLYSVLAALTLQFILIYTPLSILFDVVQLNINEWIKATSYAIVGILVLESRRLFLKE